MNVEHQPDDAVSRIAAAIGEPARARILYCLMGNRARTSTELALIADISPSTASGHLNRLREARLVVVHAQGKHRYYTLEGPDVARVLEGLSVLAGSPGSEFVATTPQPLRAARTCYDHIAGALGVLLHDALDNRGWLVLDATGGNRPYDLSPNGVKALEMLGVDVERSRALRRRLAYPCMDWSERRPHLGGAIGAALLTLALERRWVARDTESRALRVTRLGAPELSARFGVALPGPMRVV